MAIVASLDVVLNAVTKAFDAKMKRAAKTLGVLAAAAAGAHRSYAAFSESIERIDAIGKASDKLGVAADELQIMRQAAAEMSGFAAGQFDTALQRMTRRIAEAARGTGEARKAISELGLDARELNLAGPAVAFRRIADAMQRTGNAGSQLRVAFKLFDAEGAGLVSTLRGGSAAIDEVGDFMRRIGLVTDEGADKIERMNDTLARLDLVTKAAKDDIITEFAPAITTVGNRLNETAADAGGAAVVIKSAFAGIFGIAGVLEDLGISFEADTSGLNERVKLMREMAKRAEEFALKIEDARKTSKAMAEEERKIRDALEAREKRLTEEAASLREELEPPLTAMQIFLQQVERVNKLYGEGGIVLKERNRLLGLAHETLIKHNRELAKEKEKRDKIERDRRISERIRGLRGRGDLLTSIVSRIREGRQAEARELGPSANLRGTQAAFQAFLQARRDQATADSKEEALLTKAVRELTDIKKEIRRLEGLKEAEL